MVVHATALSRTASVREACHGLGSPLEAQVHCSRLCSRVFRVQLPGRWMHLRARCAANRKDPKIHLWLWTTALRLLTTSSSQLCSPYRSPLSATVATLRDLTTMNLCSSVLVAALCLVYSSCFAVASQETSSNKGIRHHRAERKAAAGFTVTEHPLESRAAYVKGIEIPVRDEAVKAELLALFQEKPLLVFPNTKELTPDEFIEFLSIFDPDADQAAIADPGAHPDQMLQPFDQLPKVRRLPLVTLVGYSDLCIDIADVPVLHMTSCRRGTWHRAGSSRRTTCMALDLSKSVPESLS
jgi:hypothetical protein